MYVTHDEQGTILHVLTGDKAYGEQLTKHGHQWIFLAAEDDSQVFNFDTMASFVDVEKKAADVPHPECLSLRVPVTLTVDKPTISADGIDEAVISGIPAGAQVTILSGEHVEFQSVVDDGVVELSASDPTTYTVIVAGLAQYLSTSVQVVAK